MTETRNSKKYLSTLCIFLYAVTASIGAFTGGLWAALGIGLAVILFAGMWAVDKKPSLPSRDFTWLVFAALLLFAAELPLSAYPALSLKTWEQLVSIFLPLLVLTAPRLQNVVAKDLFVSVVSVAAAVGALALGVELLSGGVLLHMVKKPSASLTEYNRGIAHLVILAFPLLAGLWLAGRRYFACALALALLFPAGLTESHTAKLALILGGVVTVAASYRPLWARNGLAGLSVILMGWPFYAQWFFSNHYDAVENMHASWKHRVEIWDYLSYRIAERPVLGWGLGTTHELDFTQPHGNLYQIVVQGAPHAHNFITELWVETGIVGLALGLAFLLMSLRGAFSLHEKLRPFALGAWVAALTVAMFGFDFWTDALWAAFALTVFAFGIIQQNIQRSAGRSDF